MDAIEGVELTIFVVYETLGVGLRLPPKASPVLGGKADVSVEPSNI